MIQACFSRSFWIANLTFLIFPLAFAEQYSLKEGCPLKKYQNKKWESVEASVLEEASIEKLVPQGKKVRFKIQNTWFSTDQNCMIASIDEAPPDEDAADSENLDSDEEVQPKKSKKKKKSSFSRRRAPISFGAYALAGGFKASGEGEKIQLGYGGGVKGQFGEFFAGKLQYARSSSAQDLSSGAKISISRSELTVMPLATFGSVYVGPQVGLASVSLSAEGGGESLSVSSSIIEFGVNLGLNFEINSHFSLGPDFHFTHLPEFEVGGFPAESSNILKLFLALNFTL